MIKVLAVLVVIVASAQTTLAKARSDDLQKWWDECAYDASASSSYWLDKSCGDLFAIQDAYMDALVEKVRTGLATQDPEESYHRYADIETLLESQRAFKKYRKVACLPWEMRDGSIHVIVLTHCVWDLGQERLKFIEEVFAELLERQ